MIKITTTLQQPSGFQTDEAVLEINSYNLNQTVQLVTGATMLPTAGKHISINTSVYKSIEDKNNSALAFQPVNFPMSFSLSPLADDEITESYLYNSVKAKLNDAGYNTEWLEGGED